jgi:Na+/proline symporter
MGFAGASTHPKTDGERMSGWLRYLARNAQARTGVSIQVLVWLAIAAVAAVAAFAFLCLAAFLWLANRYDGVIAGLILGGFFLLIAAIGLLASLLTRHGNRQRARLELAARRQAKLLDPKLLAVGFQLGQAIGWRKLVSLAAVALLTAGVTRERLGRDQMGSDGEQPPSEAD